MTLHQSLNKIIHLLADLVIFDSYNFEQFLRKLIQLILQLIPVDSCLIYFFDRTSNELTLIASKKPHAKLIGKIKMKKGEGITGWVAAHKKLVILEREAYTDNRFKMFKELPEDKYEAFLSIPIVDKKGLIGVINLQNRVPYSFSKEQVELLQSVVKIIASAFEAVVLERRIIKLETTLEDRKIIERAKGILMKEHKITEEEAYTQIRTEAMKKQKSKRAIAEAILLVY